MLDDARAQVGVTYGISPETLKDTPPDYLLDSMLGLLPPLAKT